MPEENLTPPPLPPTADTPPVAAATPPSAPPYAYAPPYGSPYAQPSPYPAYPQPPRRRHSAWFWIAILGGSFAVIALLLTGLVWSIVRSVNGDSYASIDGLGGSKIGVIDITGIILDADKIDTQIRKFGDDSSVKAIILHINSPGGGAAASQEIYNEVVRVRHEKNKKIVASVESVGASGAYYIASGCDKIYANNASVVGSIGVIMEWTNYGELLKWAKMKSVVIHTGTLKDAGDPTREMTPAEQAYFQSSSTTCTASSSTTSPSAATPPTTRSARSPPARSGPASSPSPSASSTRSAASASPSWTPRATPASRESPPSPGPPATKKASSTPHRRLRQPLPQPLQAPRPVPRLLLHVEVKPAFQCS